MVPRSPHRLPSRQTTAVILLLHFLVVLYIQFCFMATRREQHRDHLTLNSSKIGPLKIAFHVLATRQSVVEYLASHSEEWFAELRAVGKLIFTVGAATEALDPRNEEALVKIASLYPDSIFVQHVKANDMEYPPIAKTIQAFELLSSKLAHEYDFIYNLDDDTHFHPLRMAALLMHRNSKEPLYMGRPQHSCKCFSGRSQEANCTEAAGTTYCSGAGYAFSSSTLKAMTETWLKCWTDHQDTYTNLCQSSDMFIGYCLDKYAHTTCSAASFSGVIRPPSPALESAAMQAYIEDGVQVALSTSVEVPTHGVSWGPLQPNGWSLHIHTLLCQDPSHVGGIGQRQHIPNTHLFDESDNRLCAYMHPMKVNGRLSAPHFRYARFLMNKKVETSLSSSVEIGKHGKTPDRRCRLAINIQSAPSQVEMRDLLRSTWLQVAQALGEDVVRFYFVLGHPREPLAPHIQLELEREMRTSRDMLVLNFTECYHCIYNKLLTWYEWAIDNTECDYILKVDDDAYLRLIPLLNYLSRFGAGAAENIYFGMTFQGWDKFNTSGASPVVKNPNNKWYLYDLYPHEYLPPYVTGNVLGLSRNLVEHVLRRSQRDQQNWRIDDTAVGIFISELVQNTSNGMPIVYANTDEYWKADQMCTENSIWDSPNFSYGFNMYDRYEDDLDGIFCARTDHSGWPNEQARNVNKKELMLYTSESRATLRYASPPWTPGFNDRNKYGHQIVADWLAVKNGNLYGGVDVLIDASKYDLDTFNDFHMVQKRAVAYGVAHGICSRDGADVKAIWKQTVRFGGYLATATCRKETNTVYSLFLPHGMSHSSAVLHHQVSNDYLAIVIPAGCFIEELIAFVHHLNDALVGIGGYIRVVIGWGECNGEGEALVHQSESAASNGSHLLKDAPSIHERITDITGPSVAVKLIHTHQPFSRSSTLASALQKTWPKELVVILDVDMRVSPTFFRTIKGVVVQRQTIYFPIPFSRYNPTLIDRWLDLQSVENVTRPYFHETFTISKSTGHWVQYGYGMVAAYASDLRTLEGYDVSNKEWGMEDVDLYKSAVASHLEVLRLTDLNLVHIYHPKSCKRFCDNALPGRYRMCLGAKWSTEGTNIMLGLLLEDKIM